MILWRILLTWLVRPKKKAAVAGVTLVELAALVGAIFAHHQEDCILATVAYNDITVIDTSAAQWRSRLRGPGGDGRKRTSRI